MTFFPPFFGAVSGMICLPQKFNFWMVFEGPKMMKNHVCSESRFFNKKHVFLKIVFSRKQNHYFGKVGVDFGRPQDRPKSNKVSSGPQKTLS
jgi:hypothetical protein